MRTWLKARIPVPAAVLRRGAARKSRVLTPMPSSVTRYTGRVRRPCMRVVSASAAFRTRAGVRRNRYTEHSPGETRGG